MNKRYEIVKMHICGFEESKNGVISYLSKYPVRVCVVDRKRGRVVDIETMHEYPYVKVINLTYLSDSNVKLEAGKRYACVEYATIISLELNSDELNKCNSVIKQLKQGYCFKDGNEELTNEEYLEMINSVQKTNKLVKKLKKRK